MKTLKDLLGEVLGLFVDDGSLAMAILAIVALAYLVSILFENTSAMIGTILFVGCLIALIENVIRTTRRLGG